MTSTIVRWTWYGIVDRATISYIIISLKTIECSTAIKSLERCVWLGFTGLTGILAPCSWSNSLLAEKDARFNDIKKNLPQALSLSAIVNLRATNLLTSGTWAIAWVWFSCFAIITPHIRAHSPLEELRRRFGHYAKAKGEESGDDRDDGEFHGCESSNLGRESQQWSWRTKR